MEDRARTYEGIKNRIFLYEVLVSLAFLVIFVVSGASSQLSDHIDIYCPNISLKICVYVVYFSLIYLILTFPISLFGGFIIEKRFSLSTQTFFQWLWDHLKAFLLGMAICLIAVELIYLLLRARPHDWWLWGALLWIAGGIILARATPKVIIPIFFKLERIDDEELRKRLLALSEKAGARVKDIYSVDLSRKSRKANAAVAGLGGSKRIILSDTLMRDYSLDEIETVLSHELGHYAAGHIVRRIVLSSLLTLCAFYIAGRLMPLLALMTGLRSVADIASLPLLILVLFIFGLVILPVENAYSRRLEAVADAFSLEVTGKPEAFISAMEKLSDQNLIRREPNRMIEFLLHGHPSVSARIRMARSYMGS